MTSPSGARRAWIPLRIAALTARRSPTYIGARHRGRLTRKDTPVAITATARELAGLIYLMVTRGEDYVERGVEAYEQQRRHRTVANLSRRAKQFGFDLVRSAPDPVPENTAASAA